MATTITPTTLTVTVKEEININDSANGSTNVLNITSINEVLKKIVNCPASQTTTVLKFGSTVYAAPGDLAVGDVKYMRITNKDDTNACKVAYVAAASNFQVTLGAGESHVFGASAAFGLGDDDTSPLFPTLTNLVTVQVNPASNIVDIEVFAASA
tara:strand:+ start:234 stop:698 length:465 start_codon:yes stop_codon:yes gene_type:complete